MGNLKNVLPVAGLLCWRDKLHWIRNDNIRQISIVDMSKMSYYNSRGFVSYARPERRVVNSYHIFSTNRKYV